MNVRIINTTPEELQALVERSIRDAVTRQVGPLAHELKTVRERLFSLQGILTREDVALIFGVEPSTVDTWRREKDLPARKVGRTVLFDLQEVRQWFLAQSEADTAPPPTGGGHGGDSSIS